MNTIRATRIVAKSYETNTETKRRLRNNTRGVLASMFDGTEWHTHALCRDYPQEWWFPKVGGDLARDAKAICAICPVKSECLEWALKYPQEYGIYGSTSYKQRKRIKAARNAQR